MPNSVLWLLRFPPHAEANLRAEARKRGITAADQLVFSDAAPKAEHIRRGRLAEVCLDTAVVSGMSTGCDILWSGTPAVTVRGSTLASRVGASLLTACGLQELVCESLVEYENLAVALAIDDDKYMRLRTRLEGGREEMPLFDTRRWVANLEAGFGAMWERHEAGLPPDHIDVKDTMGRPSEL